jgi:hypothetical protein
MNRQRLLFQSLAFAFGLLALAHLIDDVMVTLSAERGSGFFLVLAPLAAGGVLALITARSAVSREWQKGPALLIAAVVFAQFLHFEDFSRRSSNADSWLEVALWILIALLWLQLGWWISRYVYRSSDEVLRRLGQAIARYFHRV